MARLYGRAKRGHRLVAAVPHGHWKTTTFVGALRCDGLTAPLVVDGAINGELFLGYVEQALVPTLKPGDVVIMDNLRIHKMAATTAISSQRENALAMGTSPAMTQWDGPPSPGLR
jgi:hypothetical protein